MKSKIKSIIRLQWLSAWVGCAEVCPTVHFIESVAFDLLHIGETIMRATFSAFLTIAAIALAIAVATPPAGVCVGQVELQEAKKPEVVLPKSRVETLMDTLTDPIRIQESKPVVVQDSQFVLVAQTNWKPAKPDRANQMVTPIEIQMRINNLRKSSVIIPTARTFGITISNAEGKEIKARIIRNGGILPRPFLLLPTQAYSKAKGVAIDLQLRITNLSKSDLVFPTFDSFGLSFSSLRSSARGQI